MKGKVSFSKGAAATMGLKKEDKICLAQDDAHPDKWYFFKDKAGYVLQEIKTGGFLIFHRALVAEFFSSWDILDRTTLSVTIDPKPVLVAGKKGVDFWLIEVPLAEE